jgi:ribosome-associated protein
MSSEFVTKEIEKIVKEFPYPLNMAMSSAWLLGNLKGINLKILDVKKTSSLADYFILASATNMTQGRAMADAIIVELKKHGQMPLSKEGIGNADWILLDMGDILVHIFLESARDVYDLDNLWRDAATVQIPNEYYFSSDESDKSKSSNSDRDFF